MDEAYIKITLIKSKIGAIPKQRATVAALGLRKINSSVIQKDNPQIRGMVFRIKYMVKVEKAAAPTKA